MPRLAPVNWQTLVCIFEKAGFVHERTRGDHMTYVKPGVLRPVIIPKYAEIGVEIIRRNMRTAEMSRDEYFSLLAQC